MNNWKKSKYLLGMSLGLIMSMTACGNTINTKQIEDAVVESGSINMTEQQKADGIEDTGKTIEVNEEAFETAQEAIKKMTLGWNIGNALDSNSSAITGEPSDWETAWGSSIITPELIEEMKEGGFDVIRIPVSWQDHLDENNRVDEAWMNRVEEVVNYVLDEDMYCILNVHHDCGASEAAWLRADIQNIDAISDKFQTLWTQIAERFKEYDEKLIFEGYNELLDENCQWTSTDEEGYKALNYIAQTFVDTVRSTGGKNAERNIIVNTYSADAGESSVSNFVIPQDSAQNHLMAEVHIYTPGRFTTNADWVQDSTSEFDEACIEELDEIFARLDQYFISKGIPVVVGEFGAQSKENDEQRALYANYFLRKAYEYSMSCIWWDDCGGMALVDRRGPIWTQPGIRNALVAGAQGLEEFEMEYVSEEDVMAVNAFEEPDYDGTALDKENWQIEAYANAEEVGYMVDGSIATRWANLEAQIPNTENQWLKINLGEKQEMNRVMLWTPNADYIREYEVYASENGENWELLATGEGNEDFTCIDFETIQTQYIRINQVGEANANYWSVYEMRMYLMN